MRHPAGKITLTRIAHRRRKAKASSSSVIPFGLEGSVTNGIVSAVRDIPGLVASFRLRRPSLRIERQPVVNMHGQVIGVATWQITRQSVELRYSSEESRNSIAPRD